MTTVFLCHDGQGNVYMSRRSAKARDEQGRWDVGGGGLKHGQSVEDNARRELKEEYGAEALEMEFLGYRDAFRELDDGTPTHWVAMDFLVLVDPAEVSLMEPEMADAGGWFTLDTLPRPLHSQIEAVFLPRYDQVLREKLAPRVRA